MSLKDRFTDWNFAKGFGIGVGIAIGVAATSFGYQTVVVPALPTITLASQCFMESLLNKRSNDCKPWRTDDE